MLLTDKINVGGQAVLEGVMMRSPKALAVAVRKSNGEVVLKETHWRSISAKYKWMGWPFFRGVVVLFESLVNGIDALTFSANQALDEGQGEEQMGTWAMIGTIAVALGLAVALFVVLPHYAAMAIGRYSPLAFGVDSLIFHLIDGVIKLAVFLGYVWVIGRMKDIARVFEYHGAEHKSIYTYEAGRELTVANAREYSTLHPRCGTAFMLVVLMISIFLFAVVFPFLTPHGQTISWVWHVFFVGVKIILLFPIAGAAYELNRYASKHMDAWLFKVAVAPGLWVQKLTTREPSDDQIEIAIIALKKALAIEEAQNETFQPAN
ncbi:MAG: DUF1385 domain-containing protein [Deltaproteobacteria bacterium]|nr:DUF1385 domain-containing protein [Deltaproteobacteria bacterium]